MIRLLTMYDDVSISLIPRTATHIAAYIDGSYANANAARAAFPHAQLLTITVLGTPGARSVDSEAGDLPAPAAARWTLGEVKAGRKPMPYASRDNWPTLLSDIADLGVAREEIWIWSAHFGVGEHICGPATCGASFQADMTQFTSHADGVSLDESIGNEQIFGPAPAPDHPHGTARFEGSVNLETGRWAIHGIPGVGVHFAGPMKYASAEIQLDVGQDGGHWRVRGLDYNAPPLGNS